jgi:hypothetical protein
VQQRDDRLVGGASRRPLLAADVDRQLGRLVQRLGTQPVLDAAAEHTGALERDEAVARDRLDLGQQALDPRARVTATDTIGRSSDRVRSRAVCSRRA